MQAPPTIASLSDSPDPVTQSNTLTLTADGVADSDGTVTRVEFYRDINNNSVLDVGTDQLLGEDTSSTRRLDVERLERRLPLGTNRYFARSKTMSAPTATRSRRQAWCKRRRRSHR